MSSTVRLILSGLIATLFYGGWSYFANAMVTDDMAVLIRSALVQGLYSGFVTLMFTWLLEHAYNKVGTKYLSFAFVVRLICFAHHQTKHASIMRKTFNRALDLSASWFKGACWPGVIVAPLIPLTVQSILVIGVNVVNQTPNLALTVAPSIFFSGVYGYMYTLALFKKHRKGEELGDLV